MKKLVACASDVEKREVEDDVGGRVAARKFVEGVVFKYLFACRISQRWLGCKSRGRN